MEANLIDEAIKFMVLGMGVVFLFLTIMVYTLKFQAKIIAKYFPQDKTKPSKTKTITNDSNDIAKIAAIVATIQHHVES